MSLDTIGRAILALGIGGVIIGILLMGMSRLPVLRDFGSLPGDIRIEGSNIACFFPVMSMCLLSVILTVVLNVVARLVAR